LQLYVRKRTHCWWELILSSMLNITAHAKIARLKTRSNEKGH
jgi:hypothetical protein